MNRRDFVSSLIASAAFETQPPVKRVMVLFKCHLDIGFVDTQAAIVRKYYDEYFPRAIDLAKSLRQSGADRYIWTTGSWLLYTYLEQANVVQRTRMEEAVQRGDIAWHALPFTWQTELMDTSLIQGCLGFSQSLDKRFGRKTSAAKMTDVPGHTRGLVPLLQAGGIEFLDIGVNAASTPPNVPELFRWTVDKTSLIVMYHRKAYGGVVRVPHTDLAIDVEVRDDNSGPHTIDEVHKIYSDLRAQYPGAEVTAANLTDIGHAIQSSSRNLATITAEIGDTWIHGVASDPTKLSRYRELARLRASWVNQQKLIAGDKVDLAFLEKFALSVEHTWGTDTKTWLDFNHYTPQDLASKLDDPKYKTVTASWLEKRRNIDDAILTLPAPLQKEAQNHLSALTPVMPSLAGLTPLKPGDNVDIGLYSLAFDSTTGAIIRMHNRVSGSKLASAENPVALFSYQTLSQADYNRFLASYITLQTDWAPKDFGKPNIQAFGATSQLLHPTSARVWAGNNRVVVECALGVQPKESITAWPRQVYLEIMGDSGALNVTLSWFDKAANRMPEALWLSFQPLVSDPKSWTLYKTGRPASPFDVVAGGNRHMHALTGPIRHSDGLTIDSLDAAVVSLGVMSPLFFSNDQPDLSKGMHYSLFNNAWGTNYIQWFGEDAKFRFRIHPG